MAHMMGPADRELKKGSAELLVLSLVEDRARHGYEIGKLIEVRSGGRLRFKVASLYPLLYRLQERGWVQGRGVAKPGETRRCRHPPSLHGRTALPVVVQARRAGLDSGPLDRKAGRAAPSLLPYYSRRPAGACRAKEPLARIR